MGTDNEALVDALIAAARSRSVDELVAEIGAYDDPAGMASAIDDAVRSLYRDFKDVDAMIATGAAGLTYCVEKAANESDMDKRRELTMLARRIGYNTAVNCWPGWADPGVTIERAQVDRALEIALRSEALARELSLPARQMGGATWLVGALELAAGEPPKARASFERAERTFLTDEELVPYALMARGYIAIADAANSRTRDAGEAMLLLAVERLRTDGSKDAAFFIDQLATAKRVFVR